MIMQHIIISFNVDHKFEKYLIDENFGKRVLVSWVMANKMNIIGEPLFHKFEQQLNNANISGGYSGIILLSESHASIHTYPENDLIFMDLFSCKSLNENLNKDFIAYNFGIEDIENSNFNFKIIDRKIKQQPLQVLKEWFYEKYEKLFYKDKLY